MADETDTTKYEFDEVVAVLGSINRIVMPERLSLKRRILRLQRGIVALPPGTGHSSLYDRFGILALAVILDLVDVGFTPSAINQSLRYHGFADSGDVFSRDLKRAVKNEVPIAARSSMLGPLQKEKSAGQLSVGYPDNAGEFGPFALVFPAVRMKQIDAALKQRADMRDREA